MRRYVAAVGVLSCVLASGAASGQSGRDLLNRAGEYLACGQIDQAIAVYGQAIQASATDSVLFLARADAYMKKADALVSAQAPAAQIEAALTQAVADYTSALANSPGQAAALAGRGTAQYRLGVYGAAIADLTSALAKNQRIGTAYYYRALAYKASGQNALAWKDYETLRAMDPNRAGTLVAALSRQ